MDISKTGFWAMILCWVSAVGGIAMAILWAASKRRPPLDRELLVKSLDRRLNDGEISQAEYDKKLVDLQQVEAQRPAPVSGRKSPPQQ
jgi:putative membrane protein